MAGFICTAIINFVYDGEKTLPRAVLAPVFLCQVLHVSDGESLRWEDEASLAFHIPTVLCAQHSRRDVWVREGKITTSTVSFQSESPGGHCSSFSVKVSMILESFCFAI